MSPWIHYSTAILAILGIVREVVPMSALQELRMKDAETIVHAVNKILELEELADDEDYDEDYDEDEDDGNVVEDDEPVPMKRSGGKSRVPDDSYDFDEVDAEDAEAADEGDRHRLN